jgi:hypothetical protein
MGLSLTGTRCRRKVDGKTITKEEEQNTNLENEEKIVAID